MREHAQTARDIEGRLRAADAEELAVLERSLAADTRKTVQRALAQARRRVEAEQREEERIARLYEFQDKAADGMLAMGLDEVGRGPLAGPLAVGAVVLPAEPRIMRLNDSKQLSPEVRAELAEEIKRVSLAWTVQYVGPADIDEMGMAKALRVAFKRAIEAIDDAGAAAGAVLIDGNPLRIDPRERSFVKGDARCACISAASIVAKVSRDALMDGYAEQYPAYGFEKNKGYGTAAHIEAIREHGLCPLHRRSFCSGIVQESLF